MCFSVLVPSGLFKTTCFFATLVENFKTWNLSSNSFSFWYSSSGGVMSDSIKLFMLSQFCWNRSNFQSILLNRLISRNWFKGFPKCLSNKDFHSSLDLPGPLEASILFSVQPSVILVIYGLLDNRPLHQKFQFITLKDFLLLIDNVR